MGHAQNPSQSHIHLSTTVVLVCVCVCNGSGCACVCGDPAPAKHPTSFIKANKGVCAVHVCVTRSPVCDAEPFYDPGGDSYLTFTTAKRTISRAVNRCATKRVKRRRRASHAHAFSQTPLRAQRVRGVVVAVMLCCVFMYKYIYSIFL